MNNLPAAIMCVYITYIQMNNYIILYHIILYIILYYIYIYTYIHTYIYVHINHEKFVSTLLTCSIDKCHNYYVNIYIYIQVYMHVYKYIYVHIHIINQIFYVINYSRFCFLLSTKAICFVVN